MMYHVCSILSSVRVLNKNSCKKKKKSINIHRIDPTATRFESVFLMRPSDDHRGFVV